MHDATISPYLIHGLQPKKTRHSTLNTTTFMDGPIEKFVIEILDKIAEENPRKKIENKREKFSEEFSDEFLNEISRGIP